MKKITFSKEILSDILNKNKTPFYIYDEKGIKDNAKRFYQAFSWSPKGFINYFAIKACPNPHILKILKEEGFGADCSSLTELILAEKVGFKDEKIIFSSNNTPLEEFLKAKELNSIINLDDVTHIDSLEELSIFPEIICFRYNFESEYSNDIIGSTKDAKFGLTKKQLFKAYEIMKEKGIKKFGLHIMPISNELNEDYFIKVAYDVFKIVLELSKKDITITFLDFGGGIGIPYYPDQKDFDIYKYSQGVKKAYQEIISSNNLPDITLAMECGRYITGPFGYLVTKVRHVMKKYKDFVGVDASMNDLMRPAIYGSYHHISVFEKEGFENNKKYDVVGSLCENNDKFAIDRDLPEILKDDILIIHDTGAHGHSMGFNYNGKLSPAEILLKEDGSFKVIRRAESISDYFSTLDFNL